MNSAIEASIAAIAANQHALITSEQAYRAGLTHEGVQVRVEAGQWVAMTRSVYRIGGAPVTDHQPLLAYILAGGPGSVASHRAAANLWQLPGFSSDVVEISKPRGRSQRIPTGRIHGSLWLPDHHLTAVDGIPVTRPTRTIFDIAGWLHPKRVERALDNAIAMRLVQPKQLAALVAELGRRGRRGTTLMRALCEARGVGYIAPASELESLLIDALAAAGLPAPDRQVSLGDAAGPVGRVDFAYRDARLVIEADSQRWHTSKLDREADAERDRRLASIGWCIIRVTWEQLVNRPETVARLIREALRAAAA